MKLALFVFALVSVALAFPENKPQQLEEADRWWDWSKNWLHNIAGDPRYWGRADNPAAERAGGE